MALTDIVAHSTLKTGLLAYYKMEGNARDSWGTNNGTAEKAITTATGKLRNSISFDGNGDPQDAIGTCQVINLGQLLAGRSSFSIGYWANLNSVSPFQQHLTLASWNGSTMHAQSRLCVQQQAGGQIDFYYYGAAGTVVEVFAPITNGSWVHWGITVDYNSGTGFTTLCIYKNGALVGSDSKNIGVARTGTIPLLLGAICWDYFGSNQRLHQINGSLDEVAVSSRAWTAAEVADLYNSGNGLPLERQPSIQNHPTLKTGLVAGYPLENLLDIGSNHLDATLVGAPSKVAGKLRDCYQLSGSSQCLSLGTSTLLAPAQFSASFWTYIVGTTGQDWQDVLARAADGTRNYSFLFHYYHGGTRPELAISIGTAEAVVNTTTNIIGRWVHWVGTYDGTTIRLYLDGASVGTPASLSGSMYAPSGVSTRIGARDPGTEWTNGKVDDVYFWSRALTADEVSDLYNGGVGITWDSVFTCVKDHPTLRSGLLSCHELNGNVLDSTQQGHDGTCVGSPPFSEGKRGKAITVSSGKYVNLQNSSGLNPAYLSIAAWAKRSNSTDTGAIVGRDYCYSLHGYGTDQVEWLCRMSGGGYYAAPAQTWNVGSWYFFVGAVDSSNLKISVNGGAYVLSGGHGGQTAFQGAWDTQIGAGGLGNPEDVDGVMIWNRSLDQSEVNDLYNFGNGLPWQVQPADINTSATLKTGLVGYYTLDSNANDSSGNTRHGSEIGSPIHAVAKLRNGIIVNGTSQYVNLGASNDFAPATGVSAFGWVYIDSTGGRWQWIADKYAGDSAPANASWGIVFDNTANTHYVAVISGSTEYWLDQSGLSSLKNSWHHVGFTYDNSTLKMYIDGAFIKQMAGGGSVNQSATETHIGHRYNPSVPINEYLKGKIDEFGIWSRALSADEVAQLYNSGTGITYDATFTCVKDHPSLRTDLLGYWTLDVSGDDISGNGRNGTVVQTPSRVPGKIRQALNLGTSGKHVFFDPSLNATFEVPNFSFSLWAKSNAHTATWFKGLMGRSGYSDGPGDNSSWHFGQTGSAEGSGYRFAVVNTLPVSFDAKVTGTYDSVWNHWVGTFDGVYVRLYKNGSEVAKSSLFSGTLRSTTRSLRIGYRSDNVTTPDTSSSWEVGGAPPYGIQVNIDMDDVAYYSRALTAAEVADLYNSGNGLAWYVQPNDINTSLTLKTGLIAYYTLDSDASDISGNSRNGTEEGTPTHAIAKLRSGLVLNGTNQRVTLGTSTDFCPTTGLSVFGWAFMDSDTGEWNFFFNRYRESPSVYSWSCNYQKSTTTYVCWVKTAAGMFSVSLTRALLGSWHHVGFTYNKSVLILYLDGQEVGRTTGCSGDPLTDSQETEFGHTVNGSTHYWMKGKLDDIGIWARGLESEEVAQLYNLGIGITWDKTFTCIYDHPTIRSGLLAHYSMNDGCIDDVNALNGTLVGSVAYTRGRVKKAAYWASQSGCFRLPLGSGIFDKDYISITCWCMPTGQVDWMNAISRWCVTGENGDYELSLDNSNPRRMRFVAAGAGGTVYVPTDPTYIPNYVWTHFSGTYDGNSARLYRNGALATYTALSEVLKHSNSTLPVWIGTREAEASPPYPGNPQNNERWIGQIDEVLIHDRALQSSEVSDLYNGGRGLPWKKVVDVNTHPTLKNSMKFYWSLDTDMSDLSGNGKNGTLYNNPTFPVGKLRTGLKLDGINQYARALATGLNPGNQSYFAVSFWFRIDTFVSGATIFSNQQCIWFTLTTLNADHKLYYTFWTGSQRIGGYVCTVEDGVWYNVIVNRDNSGFPDYHYFYVNGVYVGNVNCFLGATYNVGDVNLGYSDSGEGAYFNGKIDEVAAWGRNLTAPEISDLYNDGAGIPWNLGTHTYVADHPSLNSGLVGAWPLDRGGEDVSGNGNHGALIGFPSKVIGKIGNAYKLGIDSKNLYFDYSSFYTKFGTPSFSFAIWNKAYGHPTGGDPTWYQGIVTIGGANPGGADAVRFQFGQLSSILGGGTAYTEIYVKNTGGNGYDALTPYSATGEWVFWVVVIDDSLKLVSLYKDGICVSSFPYTGTLNDPGKPLRVGYKSSGASPQTPTSVYPSVHIEKDMDNFMWWNRTLTESEVWDLYRNGSGLAHSAEASHPNHIAGTSLATGLVGYYRLEADASDSSGNSRNGTEVGSPVHVIAKVNNGILLDGVSQRVNLGTSTDFCPTTGMSIFGWGYVDSSSGQWNYFVNRYRTDDANLYCYAITFDKTANVLYGWVNTPSGYFETSLANASLLIGSWNYVGMTYDKSVLCLYVNGNEVARKTGCSGDPRTTLIDTEFGHRFNGASTHHWMKGKLDDIGIWARALPQPQVLDLYNLGDGLVWSTSFSSVVTNFQGTPGPRNIAMTWTNPTDPSFVGVMMRRSETTYPATPTDGVQVYNGAGQSYTDEDLDPTKTYYYSIFSYDGTPTYSDPVSDDWIPLELPVVTSFLATPGPRNLSLSWDNPSFSRFSSTMIRRSDVSYPATPTDGVQVYSGSGESFLDEDLDTGSTYYYSAFVFDTYGENSDAVNEDGVPDALPVVTGFGAVTGPRKLSLSWTNPAFVRFQKVMVRRSDSDYPDTPADGTLVYQGTGQTAVDENLDSDHPWYYSVFVFDTYDANSAAVNGSWTPDELPAVTNLAASSGDYPGQVDLSWTNPSFPRFDHVVIRRSDVTYPIDPLDDDAVYSGALQAFTDGGLDPSKTYYYSIFVFDTYGAHSDADTSDGHPHGYARVLSATAHSPTCVRVTYDFNMKHSNPGNLDDALTSTNYVFTGGSVPLVATDVQLVQGNPTIVDVIVNEMAGGEDYHLKVNNVEDVQTENPLDADHDEVDFSGSGSMPTVDSTPVDSANLWVKIRFSELMGDSALIPTNYRISSDLSVLSVQKITDYVYQLNTEQQLPGLDYVLTITDEVKDNVGNSIDPDHDEVSFRGKYPDPAIFDFFSSAGQIKRTGPVEGDGVVIVEVPNDKPE